MGASRSLPPDRRWHATFPDRLLDINVNLSGKQFSQTDLVEQVIERPAADRLCRRSHLILEITESVVMENPEATIAMLQRLKDLGVQTEHRDFGTGYSSLAYLQRFPVDTMKIDRSFVARIGQGPGECRDRPHDRRAGPQPRT